MNGLTDDCMDGNYQEPHASIQNTEGEGISTKASPKAEEGQGDVHCLLSQGT